MFMGIVNPPPHVLALRAVSVVPYRRSVPLRAPPSGPASEPQNRERTEWLFCPAKATAEQPLVRRS
jgi:hypothetical protein